MTGVMEEEEVSTLKNMNIYIYIHLYTCYKSRRGRKRCERIDRELFSLRLFNKTDGKWHAARVSLLPFVCADHKGFR